MGKRRRDSFRQQWDETVREFDDTFLASSGHADAHIIPLRQPWHLEEPWCFCVPTVKHEHPITTAKMYVHRMIIH